MAPTSIHPVPTSAFLPKHTARQHVSPPPWLIPAALLFWGLLTGLWWLALPLAGLASLPALTSWRFELALKERQRVADLCSIMIVLAGGWLFLNQPRLGTALILLIQWLPGLVFPLFAVQLYGRRDGLDLSVLILSLRGGPTGSRPGGEQSFDLRWFYLSLCVIAASMVQPLTPWLLPLLTLLTAAALWPPVASNSARRLRFVAAMVVALALATGLSAGLRWSQDAAEQVVMHWMERWLGTGLDPYRATTAIGEVGRLKGSERIMLRVYPTAPIDGALLLANASYDRYVDGTWFTTGSLFEPVPDGAVRRPLLEPSDSALADAAQDTTDRADQRIVMLLRRPEGLLPLPLGAAGLTGLRGKDLHRNGFGTIRYRVGLNEPLLNYRVDSAPAALAESLIPPPSPSDLRLVGRDADATQEFSASLGLADLPPEQALRTLERHFATEFRYSLTLPETPEDVGPLQHFLEDARFGHCEYFATTAALALRAAGIPTRYVRGWSVQEYSALEDAWIARESHAHAWVLAHLEGRWHSFDPTPPDWAAFEAAQRPWTLGVSDFLAWFRLSLSGAAAEERGERNWLLLPLALLVVILAWRIVRRARRGTGPADQARKPPAVSPESPFAALETAAARWGQGRRNGETLLEWSRRLGAEQAGAEVASEADDLAKLRDAVLLHYRSRFDPAGLDAEGTDRLRRLLDDCLRDWDRPGRSPQPRRSSWTVVRVGPAGCPARHNDAE